MRFKLGAGDLLEEQTDVLILGRFAQQADEGTTFSKVNQAFSNGLQDILAEEGTGTYKQTILIHTLGKLAAKKLLCVGLGNQEEFSLERAREVAATVNKLARKNKASRLIYCLDTFVPDTLSPAEVAQAFSEGMILSAYQFETYKTGQNQKEVPIEEIYYWSEQEDDADILAGIQKGEAYGAGICLTRNLVNTPGNHMTPTILAEQAQQIAARHRLDFQLVEKAEMEKLGMGALLAVAQGSVQPPKMIVLKYQGLEEWKDVVGFVGKGITFDTGGISLKSAAKMDEMKMDMAGAGAVLGAMEVIGRLKPKCNILAVIPSTENMPGGNALKPGDVITSLSGKTIEILNTDAEGRLVLADGITYAKQLGASYLVDVATLTGAVLIALGDCTTGAVTNDEEWMIEVLEAANESAELMWRLPSFEPYKKLVRGSQVADLNNAPGRLAGTITGGLFIGEFAEDTPWVHLDIAGTAWSDKATDLSPKGASGVMVRTLATLSERISES